jgi:polyphosphate kinase
MMKSDYANIRLRSILGRFLEHLRVWYFGNNGNPDVWLSSADWMERNLFRRIEIAFPVLNPAVKKRVIEEGLMDYLDVDAWELFPDGHYERHESEPPNSVQLKLLKRWCA